MAGGLGRASRYAKKARITVLNKGHQASHGTAAWVGIGGGSSNNAQDGSGGLVMAEGDVQEPSSAEQVKSKMHPILESN